MLKRYLPDPVHRISLDDLINDEVNQILERTSGPEFSVTDAPPPRVRQNLIKNKATRGCFP